MNHVIVSGGSVSKESLVSTLCNYVWSICPHSVQGAISQEDLTRILGAICYDPDKMDVEGTNRIIKNYFNLKLFTTKEEKLKLFNIEVIIKAAIVYYLSMRPEYVFEKLTTVEELIEEYPQFLCEKIDMEELELLLTFRNMLEIALEVIPARRNKGLLMSICSILEGSGKTYTTGGTQSGSTSRRLLIFDQECRNRLLFAQSSDQQDDINKRVVTCPCGSTILNRTMWKHRKTKKHIDYLRFCKLDINLEESL